MSFLRALARTTDCCKKGSGMIIGYARVITLEQNEALQTDALDKAGCENGCSLTMCLVRRCTGRNWTACLM